MCAPWEFHHAYQDLQREQKGEKSKEGTWGGTIENLLLRIFKFSRNGRALVILLGQPGILVTAGLDTRGWSAWALFQKFPKETFLRIILFTKLSFPRKQSLDFCQLDLSYFWVVYLYFPCKIFCSIISVSKKMFIGE